MLAGLGDDSTRARRSVLPGLAVTAVASATALMINRYVAAVSPLVIALLLGLALTNAVELPTVFRAGLEFAATRLLRAGVVLLGLRLSFHDVMALGTPALGVVIATVVLTFFGTHWLGQRLGLSRNGSLLVGTGFAICGVSAIAAVKSSIDARPEEVTVAIGLVTLCGSLSILVLPALGGPLGLDAPTFGAWAGASVHDVAQVLATASTRGPDAISNAVVMKLTRVALLAPMIAGINLFHGRRQSDVRRSHPRALPGFVMGFIAMVVVRSTGLLPNAAIDTGRVVEAMLLTAALVGLGSGVAVCQLRGLGFRPLVVGALSWLTVAGVSYVGVSMTGWAP
jgi:uncharacterized integral membrane protein (TIGR00698 family)